MNLFTLYLGIEKDGNGRQLDPERRTCDMTALRLRTSRTFGGYTLTHCEGGWINGAGALVVEGALRLDIYTDHGRGECLRFAQWARATFGQAAVLMEFRDASGTELVEEKEQPCAA